MSRTPQYWDDLSDEPNTVPATEIDYVIGFEGEWFTGDFSEETFKLISDLRDAIRNRCRKMPASTTVRPQRHTSKQERTEHGRRVRDWLRKRGADIGDAGVIPHDLVDEYNQANPADYYEK